MTQSNKFLSRAEREKEKEEDNIWFIIDQWDLTWIGILEENICIKSIKTKQLW